jgi:hypothetical protein
MTNRLDTEKMTSDSVWWRAALRGKEKRALGRELEVESAGSRSPAFGIIRRSCVGQGVSGASHAFTALSCSALNHQKKSLTTKYRSMTMMVVTVSTWYG